MRLVIIGPPGSGKGTQAELLAKRCGLAHISVGDVLRDEERRGTWLGKLLSRYMDKGKLIPEKMNDEIVEGILKKQGDDFILDGYPRTLHQAEFLCKKTKINAVIKLVIEDDEAIRRLGKRRICTANHKTFIDGKITKKDRDECARLGGKIVRRDDDAPAAIMKRLDIYRDRTRETIDFFRRKHVKTISVDGSRSINDISKDILMNIQSL